MEGAVTLGIYILIICGEALLISGLTLLYPRIARRGLLFGVYVGEVCWGGEDARRITRSWQNGMVFWSLASAGLAIGGILWHRTEVAMAVVMMALPLVLTIVSAALYLRAYGRARTLAVPGLPPPAAAVLSAPETPSVLPMVALIAGILCGMYVVSYAALHYAELPAQVPTHFGPSGRPDAWKPKSFWTVMLLPMMTFIMGSGLGIMALLISRAKRALRFPQTQISAEAQMRFRQAFTRFISLIALVVTAMLSVASVDAIRVGLGLAEALSPLMMVTGIGLGVLAIGGSLYLILHYGQGGSRLERSAGNAPLTNGLADNRYWVLGVFYVNRDDPSIFVERRFGIGYTINFGNPKAVAFFAGFIILILALAVAATIKG
jgi:uncharacterized membrane protein